jgi:hypothetical protein
MTTDNDSGLEMYTSAIAIQKYRDKRRMILDAQLSPAMSAKGGRMQGLPSHPGMVLRGHDCRRRLRYQVQMVRARK